MISHPDNLSIEEVWAMETDERKTKFIALMVEDVITLNIKSFDVLIIDRVQDEHSHYEYIATSRLEDGALHNQDSLHSRIDRMGTRHPMKSTRLRKSPYALLPHHKSRPLCPHP